MQTLKRKAPNGLCSYNWILRPLVLCKSVSFTNMFSRIMKHSVTQIRSYMVYIFHYLLPWIQNLSLCIHSFWQLKDLFSTVFVYMKLSSNTEFPILSPGIHKIHLFLCSSVMVSEIHASALMLIIFTKYSIDSSYKHINPVLYYRVIILMPPGCSVSKSSKNVYIYYVVNKLTKNIRSC